MASGFARRAVVLVLLLFVTGGAGAWWWLHESLNGDAKYRLAKVERGALTAAVAASGTLNAVTTVQVGSQISGQIRDLTADFNTLVKKGQVIARIDPATYELRVNQARADVSAAQSSVEVARSQLTAQRAQHAQSKVNFVEAERDFKRKQSLVEKGFISSAERDKAQSALDGAREQVNSGEAQIAVAAAQVKNAESLVRQRESALRQAEVDLDRTYIRAPVDGIVISRSIDAGQTVAASLQAPTLFTIAQDLRQMQVETSVDEADVGRLRVGQGATFTVDAFPRRSFAGEIKQIRKAPQNVQNVVTYTVIISAANPDLSLLPGMTANVRVVVDQRDSTLKIPNGALRFRPPGADAKNDTAGENARGNVTADGRGGGGGQQFRERVMGELKLDEAQKARVQEVFADMGRKMGALRDIADEAERRKQAERNRVSLRESIAGVLRPDQKFIFDQIIAEQGSAAASGKVYVLDSASKPKALDVKLGLSDGSSTEVLGGDLKEGDDVITGMSEPPKKSTQLGPPRLF